MNKTLYVGIDVSSDTNSVLFMAPDGENIGKVTHFKNNSPGASELESTAIKIVKEHTFDSLVFGVEATSFYSFHLAEYLHVSEKLKPHNPKVYMLNPKLVRNFKKSYPDLDKTDDIDCFIIADRLRFGRLPMPYDSQILYQPLQRLTRFRYHLVQSLAKEKTYFLTFLFLKFSSYSKVKPFSNTFGSASLSVIEELSQEQIVTMSVEELEKYIMKHGKNRFKKPHLIIDSLKKVARESYRLRPALASSVTLLLAATLQNIRVLTKSIAEVDKAILKELKAIPHAYPILDSIPGIGLVYAAGIIAEIGNINRFKSHVQLARFAGLVWKKIQSGDFNAQITRMAKSGNKYLRYFLVEATMSVMVRINSYKHFYQQKYNEVTKFQHKRALVLTTRKFVRLIFALLRDNRLYTPDQPGQATGGATN